MRIHGTTPSGKAEQGIAMGRRGSTEKKKTGTKALTIRQQTNRL